MMTFEDGLKRFRAFAADQGLSQIEIAKRTGVPRTTVQRALRGDAGVNGANFDKLMKLLPKTLPAQEGAGS